MPWGPLSIVRMDPRLSNDGPILWIRPGEQLIPTAEITKTPLKRQRYIYSTHPSAGRVIKD
jgi:lysine-specific demethylase 9